MAQGKISKSSVDALVCPPGKDREFLWDAGRGSISGFGVVAHRPKRIDQAINPGAAVGSKTFVVQYRVHGRSRRYTIGEFGRLTVEQARSEARKLLADVERGSDPIENKRKERAVMTFSEVCDRFEQNHIPKLAASTAANYASVIRNVLKPLIGGRRMVDITTDPLATAHAKRAGSPAAANQVLRVFSSVWGWAERQGYKVGEKNPVKGIKLYKEEGKERFLTDAELTRLGDVMVQAETVGLPYTVNEESPKAKHAPKPKNRIRLIDPLAIAAIRLIALTGTRKREILDAHWDDISFEAALLNLPRSKTGKKPVFLPQAAVDILKTIPRLEGNPHIIPGEVEGRPRSDVKKPWDAIRAAAGLMDVRMHDLRHSFASLGASGSLGLPVIGNLLGHKNPETTARYAHIANTAAREAVEHIGGAISQTFGPVRTDNVVVLPRVRVRRRGGGKSTEQEKGKRA